MVGTNTIRQNYSREGSLDYIVNNGGEIINAVSSIDWSGEAAVFVSIVSWIKGKYNGAKTLYTTDKNEELQRHVENTINSSLSLNTDVTTAKVLHCNKEPKKVFQGQTHGHEGFLLPKAEGIKLLKKNPEYKEVLKPFLVGEELVGNKNSQPGRFVIDFTFKDLMQASTFKDPFAILQKKVLPFIEQKAKEEEEGVSKPNGRKEWLNKWWQMWRRREDMLNEKSNLKRYIAGSRVSTRIFYEFISSEINPNDALICFLLDDDYSFGIIQSIFHIEWLKEKCSTLKGDYRYTGETVFDTFPWPQTPTEAQIKKVATAAKTLHTQRTATLKQYNMSLRDLYRQLEIPGANPIKDLHAALDKAVMEAYGFNDKKDILTQLLALNLQVAEKEARKEKVQPPGLPEFVKNKEEYVSDGCVKFEWD